MEIKKLEAIIEAVLFTMGNSVELSQLAAAIEHDEETTRRLIHNMMDRYEEEDRGVRIIELENSFQMCRDVCLKTGVKAAARRFLTGGGSVSAAEGG